MSEEFDFENIRNKAIERLKALVGKGWNLYSVTGEYFKYALDGEMDAHLSVHTR